MMMMSMKMLKTANENCNRSDEVIEEVKRLMNKIEHRQETAYEKMEQQHNLLIKEFKIETAKQTKVVADLRNEIAKQSQAIGNVQSTVNDHEVRIQQARDNLVNEVTRIDQ